jgi:hypothetical protein
MRLMSNRRAAIRLDQIDSAPISLAAKVFIRCVRNMLVCSDAFLCSETEIKQKSLLCYRTSTSGSTYFIVGLSYQKK